MSDRKYDPTDPLDVAQRLAYNKALADAKKAVDIYALEYGMQDYDRAGVIAAISALEVKP